MDEEMMEFDLQDVADSIVGNIAYDLVSYGQTEDLTEKEALSVCICNLAQALSVILQ